MPPQTKSAQTKSPIIKNFTGGLNVRESITDIADNEGAASTNLIYYTAGSLVRRGGWRKLIANSPTTNALLGAYQACFNSAGTFTYYLVVTDGISMWQTSNPTATVVTWTNITGAVALDTTQPFHFLMVTNKMLVYNGKVACYWTGSGNLTAFSAGGDTLVIQDLTYTAVGTNKSATTISYTVGGTAGAEVVTVVGQAITIQIQSGTSTANQVRTAFNASASAVALASCAVSGVGGTAQTAPVSQSFIQTISCPISRVGIQWQNYTWWGGDATNPSRLYFSNLGDPTTYPSSNYIDVPNPFDGDQITGLAILFGNLLVFKRFSLYILQGAPPSNLILSKLNSSIGCIDPSSVVQIDNLVYFVSDRGLYAANLFNVRQVCYKVEPRYLAAVPYSSPATPIWVAHYKQRGQIFVSMNCRSLYDTSIGLPDRLLVHDYFNADANGDPAASEFITGYTAYELSAARPAYATAPTLMGDFFFNGSPSKPVTVMASFNDPWVYVFTEGSLAYGGPADNVSWLSSETYPPTDFLTKFFDFGDPDMIKQVRWLYTTGQVYNSVNLKAGIVYNNSPTAVSFVDFNTDVIELQSPSGSYWLLGVSDGGAIEPILTTDSTFLRTLTLQDANGVKWDIGIADDGAITTTVSTSTPSTAPVFASPAGLQFQLGVDTDGAIMTTATFAPDVTAIIPGRRVAITPIVNGTGGAKQGKYVQIYFTGIAVLSQYSMDLILKGRRN